MSDSILPLEPLLEGQGCVALTGLAESAIIGHDDAAGIGGVAHLLYLLGRNLVQGATPPSLCKG